MRIKELRKARGISQTKLGEFCGVTKATISQYENGNREPDIKTLVKIAEFFCVTVDYLLGVDDTKEESLYNNVANSLTEENKTLLIDLMIAFEQMPEENRKFVISLLKAAISTE